MSTTNIKVNCDISVDNNRAFISNEELGRIVSHGGYFQSRINGTPKKVRQLALTNIGFLIVEFQVTNSSVDIVTDSPTLSISTEYGNVNETVEAKVIIKNNPSITALRISVAYSSDNLELLEINNGGEFKEAITHSQTLTSPIKINSRTRAAV